MKVHQHIERDRIRQDFVNWAAERARPSDQLEAIVCLTGEPGNLRAAMVRAADRQVDADTEMVNSVGGFVYPKFVFSSESSEFMALIDEIADLCAEFGIEIADVDVAVFGSTFDDPFLCLGSYFTNAQTH